MRKIIINSRKFGTKEVFVDKSDFGYLNQFQWHVRKNGQTFYAMRTSERLNGKWYKIRMHRQIFGLINPKTEVDHIDHNGLNNCRSNLRLCVSFENKINKISYKKSSSKYIGVYIHNVKNKQGEIIPKAWRAQIKSKHICQFKFTPDGEIMAAKAYDIKAKEYYGEFANLNFK